MRQILGIVCVALIGCAAGETDDAPRKSDAAGDAIDTGGVDATPKDSASDVPATDSASEVESDTSADVVTDTFDATTGGWESLTFTSSAATTPCTGARWVKYLSKYSKWVGVILCTGTRYKIFLSDAKSGTYHQVGDYAGNGQDHCELVNPSFTITNEDDVKSGGCTTCNLGPMLNPAGSEAGWSRSKFGDPFKLETPWPTYNLYTVQWYECGVTIP